jgi:DNA-binding Lrp family transcriptional regulator
MPEDHLSDREALVLSVLRYGLARTPDEVAQHLRAEPLEIVRICRNLARAGLINLASMILMLAA